MAFQRTTSKKIEAGSKEEQQLRKRFGLDHMPAGHTIHHEYSSACGGLLVRYTAEDEDPAGVRNTIASGMVWSWSLAELLVERAFRRHYRSLAAR